MFSFTYKNITFTHYHDHGRLDIAFEHNKFIFNTHSKDLDIRTLEEFADIVEPAIEASNRIDALNKVIVGLAKPNITQEDRETLTILERIKEEERAKKTKALYTIQNELDYF